MQKQRCFFPLNYEYAIDAQFKTVIYNRRWMTDVESSFFSSVAFKNVDQFEKKNN